MAKWEPSLTREDLQFISSIFSIPDVYLDSEEIENLLESEVLFRKVMDDETVFIHISPYLFFRILLKRAQRELRWESYTIEKEGSHKVFIFDTDKVSSLLESRDIRTYLAYMLGSFTKIDTTVYYLIAGGRVHRFRYTSIDIEDIEERLRLFEEEKKFPLLKRIGDVALFLSGIFPEYIKKRILRGYKSGRKTEDEAIREIEEKGATSYYLASIHKEALDLGLSEILYTMSQNFNLLKKPLNFISERYLRLRKWKIFNL